MKVVVLAGGRGTRIGGSPKALAPIGERPILWHLMSHFAHHGLRDFTIALGDRGELVRQFFGSLHLPDVPVRVNTGTGKWQRLSKVGEDSSNAPFNLAPDWNVDLVNTGDSTRTAGRVRRLAPYLGDEPFLLTWCDALTDLDPHAAIAVHRAESRLVTLVTVPRPPRFGHVVSEGNRVSQFAEKPAGSEGCISAGCFIVQPEVIDQITADSDDWDRDLLPKLVAQNQLTAYQHNGYWQCMDTVEEQQALTEQWARGDAPWQNR